jgi:hypothetical protein
MNLLRASSIVLVLFRSAAAWADATDAAAEPAETPADVELVPSALTGPDGRSSLGLGLAGQFW